MENEYLHKLEQISRKNFIPVIKDDGCEFLIDFCKKNKPKRILEIGTAVGYSGSFILFNAHSDATLVTIENNQERFNKSLETFSSLELDKKVTSIFGDAGEEIKKLNGKFDLIFVDGPKGQYIKYLPTLLDLLDDNGTILADNVLYQGLIRSDEWVPHKHRAMITKLRAFLHEIETNPNLSTKVYEIGDGIAVIKKNK